MSELRLGAGFRSSKPNISLGRVQLAKPGKNSWVTIKLEAARSRLAPVGPTLDWHQCHFDTGEEVGIGTAIAASGLSAFFELHALFCRAAISSL